MIDSTTETLLTAKQACTVFPREVSLPTLWRWMLKGTRGVVLESIRIGGRRYTSKEACLRFVEASQLETQTAVRSPQHDHRKSLNQARAVLDQFNI